jgi:hypothetical protein
VSHRRNIKVSETDVRAIRLMVAGGRSRRELAKWFRPHWSTVARIARRQSWADVQ